MRKVSPIWEIGWEDKTHWIGCIWWGGSWDWSSGIVVGLYIQEGEVGSCLLEWNCGQRNNSKQMPPVSKVFTVHFPSSLSVASFSE
jgi:hypothetical protein